MLEKNINQLRRKSLAEGTLKQQVLANVLSFAFIALKTSGLQDLPLKEETVNSCVSGKGSIVKNKGERQIQIGDN